MPQPEHLLTELRAIELKSIARGIAVDPVTKTRAIGSKS